jgi:hypothetical protein
MSSLEEVIIQASVNVRAQGGKFDHVIMSWNNYGRLLKSMAAKQIVVAQVTPDISFEGLQIWTSNGPVTVLGDRECPPNYMFGLKMDSWRYLHLGDPVSIINDDGNTWLRQATADGVELRVASYGNLVCRKPVDNITILVNA